MISKLRVAFLMLLLAHDALAQQRPVIGPASIIAPAVDVVPFTTKGVLGQTANLQNWQDSTATTVASVSATGLLTISGFAITATEPRLKLTESDRGLDGKVWDFDINGGVLSIRTRTDADGAGQTALSITRTPLGTSITDLALSVNGAAIMRLGLTTGAEITTSLALSTPGTLVKFYGSGGAYGALKGETVGGVGILSARTANDASYTDIQVFDAIYGVGWNGSIAVPTKNAVYDKIETLLNNSTYQATPADPSTTSNTTGLMMGLAGAFTPAVSGKVLIVISGDIDNDTAGDGSQIQIRYGTGSAPVNGAALTGSTAGGLVKMLNPSIATLTVGRVPFSISATVALSLATAYWVDISLASITGGVSRVRDVSISIIEF